MKVKKTAKTTIKKKNTTSSKTKKSEEPIVKVLNLNVNPENPRNGFFELDWNDYFIVQLKQEGYGVDGDKDEEIIDRWFRELCANVVVDGDYGGPLDTGSLDVTAVKRDNK
ncbi:MAG: hypothetical protein VXY93_17570 [Pseudomonadota bacterium]|nr:hypothetical protein [Pseudomonadota bacterium]